MDHGRDPCPWVILNDFGGAFCMGVSFLTLRSGALSADKPGDNRDMTQS